MLTNDIWNVEKLAEEEDLSPKVAKEEDGWGVMPWYSTLPIGIGR